MGECELVEEESLSLVVMQVPQALRVMLGMLKRDIIMVLHQHEANIIIVGEKNHPQEHASVCLLAVLRTPLQASVKRHVGSMAIKKKIK